MTGTAISPKSLLQSGTPTAHERAALPLLPSGPGGIRRFPLRGAQPSTPPHEAHSTPTALEREFNPAEADCGLQGTANSPSSTVTSQLWRRGRDLNPRHRGYPCTAFPVPHLRPLGHPSSEARSARSQRRLAEGRGFEPPRDLLGPYPISSRTPSTGLGHPSASILLTIWDTHGPRGRPRRACPTHGPSASLPQRGEAGKQRYAARWLRSVVPRPGKRVHTGRQRGAQRCPISACPG